MSVIIPHVHVPYDLLWEYETYIRDNRLSLEIYFNGDTLDAISKGNLFRLISFVRDVPSLSIHAPFMDLSPGALDKLIRDATMVRFRKILEIASFLHPKTVVFHSGYEKWKYAHNIDIWLAKSLETWNALALYARQAGTKIAVENIFEDNPINLKLLMEELNDQTFGICFDVGHCNLFSSIPPSEWLSALGPYIIEIHLHDNDKTRDSHWPIGEGDFDFNYLFGNLIYKDIVFTIEAHNVEDAQKSLKQFSQLSARYLAGN